MKRYLIAAAAVALLACAGSATAQNKATITGVPEMPYTSVQPFLKAPPGQHFGESVAVATNSKGHVFVFMRRDRSRLWEFDGAGNFIREIGKNYYGFLFAHSVRVDSQDNIWTVDEGANLVSKFSPEGKLLMVLGHRPGAAAGLPATRTGPNLPDEKYTFCRPTDVAWDSQGNIFVSDGYCNNRVVKFDKNGRYITQAGSEKPGDGPAEFNLPHALQVDRQGNVYVADRTNFRYVVLDNNLKPKTLITNVGVGWTDCISTEGDHQYLFVSNSNPNGNTPGSWAITGEIYKMELDGTVLGRFGHAAKHAPGFQVVHMMDCRNPNTLIVGEIESWRVQKLLLGKPGDTKAPVARPVAAKPAAAKPAAAKSAAK